ncbi:MAG TPA: hypothetical protein PL163_21555, partial [Leptospiraceae bacterium]|nr:hypothetical protein [Leptospiraceae bacterium]
ISNVPKAESSRNVLSASLPCFGVRNPGIYYFHSSGLDQSNFYENTVYDNDHIPVSPLCAGTEEKNTEQTD